jgi:hypothetical protein
MKNKNENSCKQVVREAAPRLTKLEYVVRVVASISKPTERIVPETGSAKGWQYRPQTDSSIHGCIED